MPTLPRFASLALSLCALGLVACTTDPDAIEAEAGPILIGATMSLSGNLSTQGIAAANGYRLCEADINAQGGLLGRSVRFVIHDDHSDGERAVDLYEQLIVEEGVDLVMGPYGSTLTEAVAPVTERHRKVHISPLAATSSIWEQGREYLFMVLPPAELFLAGLIDMADGHGLQTVAVVAEDALFPRAAADGAAEIALERGMRVPIRETYSRGDKDFSDLLERIRHQNVEVLAMAASSLDDFVEMVEQMRSLDVTVAMFGTSGAVSQFAESLGASADYAYGLSAWEPGLPNPGIEDFVEAYETLFQVAPSFHAAGAYGSCQLLIEAIERSGSLDDDDLRDELLALETTTIFSDYAVDDRGYQTANRGLFIQWQDGEKVIVWPEDLATRDARYPTPRWQDRSD